MKDVDRSANRRRAGVHEPMNAMVRRSVALVLAAGFVAMAGSGCKMMKKKSAPPPVANFAGTFDSNWGPVTFTQTGTKVNAVYSRGTMSCTASDKTLDCDWKEAHGHGKARLTLTPPDDLKGTWGSGKSYTAGGTWTFHRSKKK